MDGQSVGGILCVLFKVIIEIDIENKKRRNSVGQLGYGDTENRGDDVNEMGDNLEYIDLGNEFIIDTMALGAEHSCALSTDHTVKCFGRGAFGCLGVGNEDTLGDQPGEMGQYLTAIDFGDGFIPKQLYVGSYTGCVVSTGHALMCWGDGRYGLLGQGNTANSFIPLSVDLGIDFIIDFVNVGYGSACAVSIIGTMKCWGLSLSLYLTISL